MSEIIELKEYSVQETPLPNIYINSMIKQLSSGVLELEDKYNIYYLQADNVSTISIDTSGMGRNKNICDIEFQLQISLTEGKKISLSPDFMATTIACNAGLTVFKVSKRSESNKYELEELSELGTSSGQSTLLTVTNSSAAINSLYFPWTDRSARSASYCFVTNNDLDIRSGTESGSEGSLFLDFYALTRVDHIILYFQETVYTPTYIKVSGSMDAKNWTLLSTDTSSFPYRSDHYLYLDKRSYYRYYRLTFGMPSAEVTRIRNVRFYGHKFDTPFGHLQCITPYTGSNSISGYVFSTGYNSTYANSFWMAKDTQDTANSFDTNNYSSEYAWYKIELPEAKVANFALINTSPNWDSRDRMPYWFMIEGSNDDLEWTQLYEENIYQIPNCSSKGIHFNNTTAYKYYRIRDEASFSTLRYQNCRYFKLFYWSDTNPTAGFANAIPKLTSSTQEGYTVSASSTVDGNVVNLFDDSSDTIWAGTSNQSSWSVTVKLPYSSVFTACMLQARSLYTEQAPYTFTIYGSENGEEWTQLYYKTGEASWTPSEKRLYSFENTNAYIYYKLEVSQVNNHIIKIDNNNYCGLSELGFGVLSLPLSRVVHTYTDTYLVPIMNSDAQDGYISSASSTYGGNYSAWRAFDRNAGTGWVSANNAYPAWIQSQLPSSQIFSQIYIKAHNDFYPYSFKIQGSNDNENWIDLYANEAFSWNSTREAYINFNNKIAFLYYRLLTFSAGSSGSQTRTEVHRFDFIERKYIDVEE